jgi:uncharacterized protein with HEPN domain
MQNKILKYLFDIKKSCDLIINFTEEKSFNDYDNNKMLSSAVERQFEIIGEALNQAIKLEPQLTNIISESRSIVDFRNLLIHAYSSISSEVVWTIIKNKLPILYQEVTSLLEQNSD